jgi:two-component system, NarL family, sensor histidine kinase DevS
MKSARAWRADRQGCPLASAEQQPVPAGLRGVLQVAREVVTEVDLDRVLERVVEATQAVSGARYVALGVLDEARCELERFITVGIDEDTKRRIGSLPHGRGVLGELIEHPGTLRLADVGEHPHSYGFPPEHPPMRTFLGVPVMVEGEPFGNLYLCDKAGGEEFTEEDEQTVELLADFAGVAIDHARRYSGLASAHAELRHTVDTLEATLQIARALGGETDLARILELVAKRGRALVSARALVIEHEHAGELVVAAGAGELPDGLIGRSVDRQDSLAGAALRTLRTLRLEDDANRARFERHGLGRLGVRATAGMIIPLVFRGEGHGVLIAVDRLRDGPAFTAKDQRLLEAFAASAAIAVATAETVAADRRRQQLAAAEQERARWARELHDETLQNLAALRIGLAGPLRKASPGPLTDAAREVVSALEGEIESLRALITDVRPAALDDMGTAAALEALADRARSRGLNVDLNVDLAYEQGRRSDRHTIELETTMYRLVQEALTNATKHGQAQHATVDILEDGTMVRATIKDDGRGFDATAPTGGFGLIGMHERAELLDGDLEIESAPGEGTTVRASLPAQRRSQAQAG